jgi:hypothetical protein
VFFLIKLDEQKAKKVKTRGEETGKRQFAGSAASKKGQTERQAFVLKKRESVPTMVGTLSRRD